MTTMDNLGSLLIDTVRLLFRKEKKSYCILKRIMGFYPHNLELYRLAVKHKSLTFHEKNDAVKSNRKTDLNTSLNNERLEFLGDAVLGAIVADILYKKYKNQQEGFLTMLRSKIVCRESLNRIAVELGIDKFILHSGDVYKAHNSYVNGNAFEAFCGAIYLDRGYKLCYQFIEKEFIEKHLNIEELIENSQNNKSKLIEWCQKQQYKIQFTYNETRDRTGSVFTCKVFIEGIECGHGKGYKKKDSDQNACKAALQALNSDPNLKLHIAKVVDEKLMRARTQSNRDKVLTQISSRNTIVFDLDGTLMDTLQDLYLSTNYALRTCNYPERTLDEIRSFVGNGVKLLIERAMPNEITAVESEENKEAFNHCFNTFKEYYIEHCQDNTKLYDGINPLLNKLKEAGYRTAIVSNKLQAGVTELYEKWFKDTIEVAIGESPEVRRKPAPDMVEVALKKLGVEKSDAIYIGDSDVDLQTAKNSGLPCISVLWGFRSKEFLIDNGALITVEKPDEIMNILSN